MSDKYQDAATKRALREVFREAFDRLGGADWLVEFATKSDENGRAFLSAVTKLIPMEITGKDGAPLTVIIQDANGEEHPVGQTLPGEAQRLLN